MKFQLAIVGLLLVGALEVARAANILGLFLTHSPSHVILHMSVARALVDRGHNVTVITSIPLKDQNPGYRHIFLKELQFTQQDIDSVIETKDLPFHLKLINGFLQMKTLMEKYSNYVMAKDFISFIEEDNKFDLMLLGYTFNEFQLRVAAHFKCPIVLSWVIQPVGHLSRIIGNPTLPAIVPAAPFMDSSPMNFFGRVLSFVINAFERSLSGVFEFYLETLYKKNYPSDKYPSFAEMKRNVSLVLFNHHFSESPVRPLVPGLVEIGGIQIKDKRDPLPENISKFLENSPQGAIFFSLGSYTRVDHLGANALNIIYKVFSSLPYNIIWKFNSETQPGNASNILYKKWLPQDDILSHRNLKLFVTHGGKGSVTESQYHGVPMVAIPLVGDQHGNANAMQAKGYGVVCDYQTMTEDSFREAVVEVMKGENYKNAVQQFSRLYRDRPLSARENAVFWIEYVIRHRGARHMQSPLKTLNIFQENSIDVIAFLIGVIYISVKLVKILVRILRVMVKSLWNVCKPKRKAD